MEPTTLQSQPESLNYVEPYWSSKPIRPYYLEIIREGVLQETISLESKSYYVLGRHPQCDIHVDSPSASRKHLVIQHKDTGGIFLYDLGSTHGTFLNRKIIPPFKYVEIHVGDHFRLGVSSKTFVVGGPEELQPKEEEEAKVPERPKDAVSREAIFRKRVEQIHRLHEEREKNKLAYKHSDEGITWGIEPDDNIAVEPEKGGETSSEEEDELNLEAPAAELIKSQEWTEKQKGILGKLNEVEKKQEKLQKEKATLAKKAETGFEEPSQREQRRLQGIDEQMEKLKKQQNDLKTSLKSSMGGKKKKAGEEEKILKRRWRDEEDFPSDEDEFYDRTKRQAEQIPEINKGELQHENYESLKAKLETLIKERQSLMDQLMQKSNSDSKSESEKVDPLDQFMASTEKTLIEDSREKLTTRLTKITEEINKCNAMLKYVTPTFAAIQHSKVDNNSKREEIPEEKKPKKTQMSLAETMQRIEEIKREKERKEQERIARELEAAKKIEEAPVEIPEQIAPQPEEIPEAESSNYFAEIIKNVNKDEINLEDYKIIKARYEEYNKRKQDLAKAKAAAPAGEKKYGLEYFFKEPDKTKATFTDLFQGKRPMQSSGVVDPVSRKVRRVQGPTPKPEPRNLAESREEKEEYEEDIARYASESLEVPKKPHQQFYQVYNLTICKSKQLANQQITINDQLIKATNSNG
eukprot:TRINITY_DN688_c0_g1_i1.p2 TRINITY_DN688_c0_g1~~TRINITY_DN688_c0_g1_i1.p2  ORF type:complete len:693 (+),score=137.66 TRINITY_DN688_c0_g1_i1:7797-9875(+)